jgi:diguanylate cyclase (GGDEF)-like protein
LPGTDHAGSMAVGEGLRSAVERLGLEHRASQVAAHVTISVGVATARPSEAGGLAPLVQTADSMLYVCKSAGRNCARGVQLPG